MYQNLKLTYSDKRSSASFKIPWTRMHTDFEGLFKGNYILSMADALYE